MSNINTLKKFISSNIISEGYQLKKEIESLSEARTIQLSNELIKKIFKDAAGKVSEVDFGDIPNSKGDITKVKDYDKLKDSLELLKQISIESKEPIPEIDIVKESLTNLEKYTEEFQKGFSKSNDVMILLYSTTVLGIYYSVSYLISVAVEYIKDPSYDTFKTTITSIDKKDKDVVISNLNRFNNLISKGDLDKLIKANEDITKKQAQGFTGIEGYAFVELILYLGLATSIIPIIKELIYQFYYSRVKFADFCTLHSDFLEGNIEYLKNNPSVSSSEKKKIISKQKKVIDNINKLRNFIELRTKKANIETNREIIKRNVEYKDLESDLSNMQTNNSIII